MLQSEPDAVRSDWKRLSTVTLHNYCLNLPTAPEDCGKEKEPLGMHQGALLQFASKRCQHCFNACTTRSRNLTSNDSHAEENSLL